LEMTENEICVPQGWMFYVQENVEHVSAGTIINFVWDHGHNVLEVASQADCDACTGFSDHAEYDGSLAWTVPEERGTYYMVCGVGSHCSHGNQKLAVTVGAC
jgi:plastocyanin